MSAKSFFRKLASFLKSFSKIKLDEKSWLEVFGPENYYYCENTRRLLFYIESGDSKFVKISVPRNWGPTSTGDPITNEDLKLIAGKLKNHFETKGQTCMVECYDPWKQERKGGGQSHSAP
jgi:hypothetical protein